MDEQRSEPARTGAEANGGYDAVLTDLVGLLEQARRQAARSVNAVMTAAYWEIGRRLVEVEQGEPARAEYGTQLLKRLSADLTARFGRGFSRQNLQQMRQFYLAWQKCQTLSSESELTDHASQFPLPWSHYVTLLRVQNPSAREFYETESLRGGWSLRQLDRQVNSLFYSCRRRADAPVPELRPRALDTAR